MSWARALISKLLGKEGAKEPDFDPCSAPSVLGDAHFRMLAENSTDVICLIGQRMELLYVSPSAKQIFGWSPQEMIDGGPAKFVHPDDVHIVAATDKRLNSGEIEYATTTYRVFKSDGVAVWVEASARKTRDPNTGKLGDTVIVMRDITDRKRMEEQLSVLALTDGLTGLANRRAFDEALDREWRRTLRDRSHMSLLILDLDHFKQFNDRYGHQAGDDCLRVVASAIKGAVRRPADLVARYGGEELGVILPGTDAAGGGKVAEAVRASIEALSLPHVDNLEGGGWVTASIGVATAFCRTGGTMNMPEGLLLAADGALYKAKRDGRNQVATTSLFIPCQLETSAEGQACAAE